MARGSTKTVNRRSARNKGTAPSRKGSEGGAPRKKRTATKGGGAGPKGKTRRPLVRAPDNSDELKHKISALMSATSKIRSLKRALASNFWEIGEILSDVQDRRLYEAKGYTSLEAFATRELDLPKNQGDRILRITRTFRREAAEAAGLERTTAALAALDGEEDTSPGLPLPRRSASAIPLHKR